MMRLTTLLAALFLGCAAASLPGPAAHAARAQDGDRMMRLYEELADPDNPSWQRAEADLLREWSKSGSAAMDLLLKRGQEALKAGDNALAIEHFTALTDHAPDFAEGWNGRATAYFLEGRFGPSLWDIRRVLALNPHHFGALAGLGTILQEMGRQEAARDAFRASLALNPHQKAVAEALGRLETALAGTDI